MLGKHALKKTNVKKTNVKKTNVKETDVKETDVMKTNLSDNHAKIVCDLSIKIHRIMRYSDPETKKMIYDLITEFDRIATSNHSSSEETVTDKGLPLLYTVMVFS